MRRSLTCLLLLVIFAALVGGCAAGNPQAKQAPAVPLGAEPTVRFVRFKTGDGLVLFGRVFGGAGNAVILGHTNKSDQTSWVEAAAVISGRGFRVLTFDFRGYGLSEGIKDASKMDQDTQAAVDFMRRSSKRVFLVGAGAGGTAALIVAAETRVTGVAAVSAPADSLGLRAPRITDIKAPKLFIAAAHDDGAPEVARRFYSEAAEPKELQILPGAESGTNLMQSPDSAALKRLVDWLKRNN